jgi:hypothetical protein
MIDCMDVSQREANLLWAIRAGLSKELMFKQT